jgi:hypothetical protein
LTRPHGGVGAFAVVAVLAACGSSGDGIPRLAFGYDASAPLSFRDRGVLGRSGRVDVHDVSFQALLNMVHAALKGTQFHWYAARHALNVQAYRDAFAWLQRELA